MCYADYEVLHECQYPDPSSYPDKQVDCARPAPYRVYWINEDGSDGGEMFVCEKHFKYIMECEKNQGTVRLT